MICIIALQRCWLCVFLVWGLYDLHSSESAYSLYFIVESRVQGDPNQSLLIQMAITLKICISDPMLVKPKCVLEVYIYFDNYKQTADKNVNKCTLLKHILALPIWGQLCTVSVLQPFLSVFS